MKRTETVTKEIVWKSDDFEDIEVIKSRRTGGEVQIQVKNSFSNLLILGEDVDKRAGVIADMLHKVCNESCEIPK